MKRKGLVVYGLVMLFLGALLGGGVAYAAYANRVSVGKTNYGITLFEDKGIITFYSPNDVANVRQFPHEIRFDVVRK